MKQITKKLQKKKKRFIQPVRGVAKSLIHCTNALSAVQRKPPDCAKLRIWTDSVKKWGHRIYINRVSVFGRCRAICCVLLWCCLPLYGAMFVVVMAGCGGGCGNISDSVFTWIVWHDHDQHHMRMPKSNMEYKAGSMQCRMDIIDVTGNLTGKQTHTDKSSCCVPHTGNGKCARKRNGKLNGKTDQNDHRHTSDGGNGAHSAFTTVSADC